MSNEVKTLRITSLAAGGDGLGHLEDGRVVFVEGGVPGDEVELADLRLGKRMAHARVGRVVVASADRIEPRCRHFGTCGGCAWQHVRYEAQLEAKRGIVRDALERIGGLEPESIEITASPREYQYRARARLVETAEGLGYRKRHSREAVAVSECPILVPRAEAVIRDGPDSKPAGSTAAQRRLATTSRRKSARRREREIEILAGSSGEARTRVTSDRSDSGETVEIEVLGERLEARVGSFVQGNALLWEALAEEVRGQTLYPPFESGPRIVELYAGIGFLTVPLARAGCRGDAFESGRSAVRDLASNLARLGPRPAIGVVRGRVEKRGDWEERLGTADVVILDPPRTGVDARLRSLIAECGPQRVVYVSCDPATLARDLREFVAGGYRLAHLRAFDLFPQTAHVETVVRLERDDGQR